jgi:hypothetical protein
LRANAKVEDEWIGKEKEKNEWASNCVIDLDFFVPNCIATIELLLRRTVIRSVILLIIFGVYYWYQPFFNSSFPPHPLTPSPPKMERKAAHSPRLQNDSYSY